jgi:hypothetical protein
MLCRKVSNGVVIFKFSSETGGLPVALDEVLGVRGDELLLGSSKRDKEIPRSGDSAGLLIKVLDLYKRSGIEVNRFRAEKFFGREAGEGESSNQEWETGYSAQEGNNGAQEREGADQIAYIDFVGSRVFYDAALSQWEVVAVLLSCMTLILARETKTELENAKSICDALIVECNALLTGRGEPANKGEPVT